MKIIENNSFINIDAYARNIDPKKNEHSPCESNTEGILKKDTVELSTVAKKIQTAKEIIDAIPDIREQKIAHIKERIENENYQFNGKKIAVRMLKESFSNNIL